MISLLAYVVGLGGMYMFLDGVSSLWQYTRPERKGDQGWLRDHSFRLARMAWGISFMIIAVMI